ncbi:hypothetical protein NTH60_004712 [Enterobacter ludwigii]|nr:hypothetical protein [Enterobacter ludwigii]
MPTIVLTKNKFLRLALSSIVNSSNAQDEMMIIDTDSYTNLNCILDALEKSGAACNTIVCFIGSPGVTFQVLLPLKIISLKTPLDRIEIFFSKNKFLYLNESIKYLRKLQGLTMLTRRQQECVNALSLDGEVRTACKHLSISEKAFYGRLRKAGEKINLFNLAQIKVYLSNNYL